MHSDGLRPPIREHRSLSGRRAERCINAESGDIDQRVPGEQQGRLFSQPDRRIHLLPEVFQRPARTFRIEAQALAMCNKAPSPSSATVRVAKANPEDVDQATVPPEGGAMISGGGATAAGAVNQLKDQLEPWANTIQWVQYILIAVALVGVGLTIWAIIKNRRAKQVA